MLATYSRCRVEPDWGKTGMPSYANGQGCDVYKLDLGTGKEVRYTKVNASDGNEYWPSYWKGRIAFARAYDNDRAKPYLYAKTIESSAPSQRLPGGSRGVNTSSPLNIELYGTRVGFAWRYQGGDDTQPYDLRIDTIGGGHVVLDHTTGDGQSLVYIGWPSFEEGRVYWLRSCFGDPGGCPPRIRFEQSAYTGTIVPLVAVSPLYTTSMDIDNGVLWTLTDVNSIYGCQTDPATTPQCRIEPFQPNFAPLN